MRSATAFPGLSLHLPIVVLTFALMLAGPYLAGGVFAGTEQPPTEIPETAPTESPSEMPPEPTAVPTEAPPAPTEIPSQPTDVPAQPTAEPAPQTADIINYVRICPAGYEPGEISWAAFLDDCPDTGAGFTLSVTVPDGPWLADTSGAAGMVTFPDIPAGEVTMSMQPRDGFGDPYVFCSVEGSDALQPVATPGSEFRYGVRADLEPTSTGVSGEACFWFNIPLDEGNGGTIFKYTCPEGFDPTGATLDDFLADCEAPGVGITLAVTGENYAVEEMTDPAGMVPLADLPLGTITITERDASEYELVVFCEHASGAFAPVATTGRSSVDVVVQEGFEVVCYFFNVPVEPDVTVAKYYCLPDSDLTGLTLDEAIALCDEDGPDVSFGGIGDEVVLEDQVVSPGGRIAFHGVPAGELTVTEDIPEGYGDPVVLCEADGALEAVASTGGSATIDIPSDFPTVHCAWFNIPEDDGIVIRKFYCPPGYEAEGATLDTLLADCTDPGGGVSFSIAANGYAEDATTDERGFAIFPNVPAGIVSLTEHAAPGFEEDAWVYCTAEGAASFTGSMLTQGESGELQVGASGLDCYVFNIPPALSEVIVIKYLCRPGVEIVVDPKDVGPTFEDYLGACPDTAAGVGFAMSNVDYQVRSQTDADGVVTFSDVPLGRFELEEDLPRGYGDPVVFCGWSNEDGAVLPVLMPTYRTFLDAAIPEAGVRYVCHWFNIALEPEATGVPVAEDTGRLLIETHACPPGISLGSPLTEADLSLLSVSCPDFHEGVEFDFSNALGFELQQTTNQFGGIAIIDAPSATMRIDEAIPDGYGEPVVYCYVDDGSGGSIYAPMSPVDGAFDYFVRGGINNVCAWFNMPEPDETSTLRLVSHACPAGVDPSRLRLDASLAQCADVLAGVGFTVTGDGYKTYGLTGGDGTASFVGVPFGRIKVLPDPIPGYARAVVLCGWSGESGGREVVVPPRQVPLTNAILDYAIPAPNAEVTCFWFNLAVPSAASADTPSAAVAPVARAGHQPARGALTRFRRGRPAIRRGHRCDVAPGSLPASGPG